MNRKVFFGSIIFSILLITSCSKHEGPGGTSSIKGTITGRNFEPAENEITEIIVSPGSELEHGDYFIINAPIGGILFYVWYDNPTWITDGDPGLSGRTGIPVEFNYSDSNTDIATNTADSIVLYAGWDFDVAVQNDIITLTNKTTGNVADANNMTTVFEINIANQGEDEILGSAFPAVNEKVYVVYGNATNYGDEVQTGGDGDFSFTYLKKGNYSIYVVSQDTLSPSATIKNSVSVTVDKNKSEVSGVDLEVIH